MHTEQRGGAAGGTDGEQHVQRVAPSTLAVDPLGQPGHGRRLEHCTDRELHAQRAVHPVHQASGEEGVAAQVEEAVVHADLGQTEHLGEDAAQGRFALGGRFASRTGDERGGGQCAAVQLAVGGTAAARPA
ncbi:hypothetical protein GCM10020000_13380 [Streptomyces olivoverticillatus]